jgi:hypothetical protein
MIGFPEILCNTFGVFECIRLPLPAANIIVLIFSFEIDCFSVGTVKYNQISKFVKIKKASSEKIFIPTRR